MVAAMGHGGRAGTPTHAPDLVPISRGVVLCQRSGGRYALGSGNRCAGMKVPLRTDSSARPVELAVSTCCPKDARAALLVRRRGSSGFRPLVAAWGEDLGAAGGRG
jgi:hypothetical protein